MIYETNKFNATNKTTLYNEFAVYEFSLSLNIAHYFMCYVNYETLTYIFFDC